MRAAAKEFQPQQTQCHSRAGPRARQMQLPRGNFVAFLLENKIEFNLKLLSFFNSFKNDKPRPNARKNDWRSLVLQNTRQPPLRRSLRANSASATFLKCENEMQINRNEIKSICSFRNFRNRSSFAFHEVSRHPSAAPVHCGQSAAISSF